MENKMAASTGETSLGAMAARTFRPTAAARKARKIRALAAKRTQKSSLKAARTFRPTAAARKVRALAAKRKQQSSLGIFTAKGITKIATWNVGNLNGIGKLARVIKEFDNYRLHILGVAETHWPRSGGGFKHGNKIVLHSGNPGIKRKGVALILSEAAAKCLKSWSAVTERIISARFVTEHAKVSVIQVYSPTDIAEEDEKKDFYNTLLNVLKSIPENYIKIVLGDFNAQIGKDSNSCENVNGPYGSADCTTNNGDRLIDFCATCGLVIGNTFFNHKPIYKKTWKSADGITENEIDYICISNSWQSSLSDVRAQCGVDMISGLGQCHYLLVGTFKWKLNQGRSTKSELSAKQMLVIEKLKNPNEAEKYAIAVQNQLENGKLLLEEIKNINVDEHWKLFKEAINSAAKDTLEFNSDENWEVWMSDDTWNSIDAINEMKIRSEALGEITTAEVNATIESLINSYAVGYYNITAELLQHGGMAIIKSLCLLFNKIWNLEQVPGEWKEGIIVHFQKMDDLSNCTNERGITQLPIPGRVFCEILLNRMKSEIDDTLQNEQLGIKSGKSCIKHIFTIRNIIEQSLECNCKCFINFLNFKKAFASIDGEMLWKIVSSYRIPDRYINIMRSFYNGSHCGNIETGAGLSQGCILTKFLFQLVISWILREALVNLQDSEFGIKFSNDNNAKSHRNSLKFLYFEDEIALFADSLEVLKKMTISWDNICKKFGLHISCLVKGVMKIGDNSSAKIDIDGLDIKNVQKFTYLRSVITVDGDVMADVAEGLNKARAAFNRLRKLWDIKTITLEDKLQLYSALVIPLVTYGSETWKIAPEINIRVNLFHQQCLRRLLNISRRDQLSNVKFMKELSDIVTLQRWSFIGDIFRMPKEHPARIAMTWKPSSGGRKPGRPTNTWQRSVEDNLESVGLHLSKVEEAAQNPTLWRDLTIKYICETERAKKYDAIENLGTPKHVMQWMKAILGSEGGNTPGAVKKGAQWKTIYSYLSDGVVLCKFIGKIRATAAQFIDPVRKADVAGAAKYNMESFVKEVTEYGVAQHTAFASIDLCKANKGTLYEVMVLLNELGNEANKKGFTIKYTYTKLP